MIKLDNLKTILRCIASGDKKILVHPNRDVSSMQVEGWDMTKDCKNVNIEDRLKEEIFGYFPLTDKDEIDFIKRIRPAFKLSNTENYFL